MNALWQAEAKSNRAFSSRWQPVTSGGNPVSGSIADEGARSRPPYRLVRGKDPFHRRRRQRDWRWKWHCHQRWRRRSIRAAAHNQRHHHGSLTRTRRALRTMEVGRLSGMLIDVSLHESCDTEGHTPMPSSRVMAACAAGGNNCCRMGWRSSPSCPRALRGDSGPKRSGW